MTRRSRTSSIIYIYVREKIEHGLKDIEEGRILDQEEIERRMSKWLGK